MRRNPKNDFNVQYLSKCLTTIKLLLCQILKAYCAAAKISNILTNSSFLKRVANDITVIREFLVLMTTHQEKVSISLVKCVKEN